MSAWMSGIGLGLQAAQMEQQRNQQAQEMAFRQQQADINNQQQDRQFQAAQSADIRDFDAMQQWRAFQRQQQEQQYKIQQDEIARNLATRNASAMIFKAAAMPPTGPAPGGVGPVQPHAIDTIPDATIMQADSNALRALMDAKKNNAAYAQRREVERQKAEAARADGSIRNISPEQADVWRSFGFYYDGTIGNDEMPLSMREQEQQRQEALASFLATERDANGNFTSNPQVFDHYRSIPLEYAERAFDVKVKHDAAMQLAQAKGAAGPTLAQRLSIAKTALGTAEKEYRAAAGDKGKQGILAEPTDADRKLAETAKGDIDAGWWDPTGPQPEEVEKAKKKVEAWDRYRAAVEAVDGIRAGVDGDISQRGILDGPNGPEATDTTDPNELTDDDRARFAEIARILGG